MRMTWKQWLIGALIIVVLAFNCFAGEQKQPKPIDPRFTAIESIVILPAVDARNGKKQNVKLEDLQKNALNGMKKKNFTVTLTTDAGTAGEIVEEDLKEAKSSWIQKLGPSEARWVMIVCLGDVSSKMTFGSTGNAELSGYLFDKQTATLVWKDKGVGQAGQGGLLGMMMKSTMSGEALAVAMSNLLSSIPKLPKPAKK